MAYVIRSMGHVNVMKTLLLPLILPIMALAISATNEILKDVDFSG